MIIKAVIFDMDGVLIDAKDWHYEALNRALGLFGMSISRQDHLSTFDGLPTKVKLKMISEKYKLPISLHDFINEMKQIYTYELVHLHCKPRFEQEYALSRLKRDGYRIGVASNSIRYTIELMMEKSNLRPNLDIIASNQDIKKPKPDPEIYNFCINHFGLKPSECVVVEDNENGIKAAKDAGAHVLTVSRVEDVNYKNISNFINRIEKENRT